MGQPVMQSERIFGMGPTGTVDPQGRVVFPRNWRRPGDESATFFLAPGLSRSISLFPEDSFNDMVWRVHEAARYEEQDNEWIAIYMQLTQEITLDSHGRFPIPDELLRYAGLTRKGECQFVSGIGIGRIFAPDRWRTIKLGRYHEPKLTPEEEELLPDDELETITIKKAIDYIKHLSRPRETDTGIKTTP